jgi:hypothetical protein
MAFVTGWPSVSRMNDDQLKTTQTFGNARRGSDFEFGFGFWIGNHNHNINIHHTSSPSWRAPSFPFSSRLSLLVRVLDSSTAFLSVPNSVASVSVSGIVVVKRIARRRAACHTRGFARAAARHCCRCCRSLCCIHMAARCSWVCRARRCRHRVASRVFLCPRFGGRFKRSIVSFELLGLRNATHTHTGAPSERLADHSPRAHNVNHEAVVGIRRVHEQLDRLQQTRDVQSRRPHTLSLRAVSARARARARAQQSDALPWAACAACRGRCGRPRRCSDGRSASRSAQTAARTDT